MPNGKKLLSFIKSAAGFLWSQAKQTPARVEQTLRIVILTLGVVTLVGALSLALRMFPPQKYVSSLQVLPNLPRLIKADVYDPKASIVRILDKDGQFECTGFVVGKNYVLTAGHCLVNEEYELKKEPVYIENMTTGQKVKAIPAGLNTRLDWGLIKGDFSKMPAAVVAYNQLVVEKTVGGCGYPQGSHTLHCEGLSVIMNDGFQFKCIGILFPGMSGGPVFNHEGVVIGINTAAYMAEQGGGAMYSPTIGIFAGFGIAD